MRYSKNKKTDYKPVDTFVVDEMKEKVDDYEAFYRYIGENIDSFDDWEEFVEYQMRKKGLHLNEVAFALGKASSNFATYYIHKIPSNRQRSVVIALAIIFEMSVDETNEMLTKKARMRELYDKDIEDAIWKFLINKNYNSDYDKIYYPIEAFKLLKSRLEAEIATNRAELINQYASGEYCDTDVDTDLIGDDILDCETQEEFEAYIHDNLDLFRSCNQKLIEEIDHYSGEYQKELGSKFWDLARKHYIPNIKKGKVPDRDFLILFGLFVGNTMDSNVILEINSLLEIAHMAPLYSKCLAECLLMCAFNRFKYDEHDEDDNLFDCAIKEIETAGFIENLPEKYVKYFNELREQEGA